MCVKLYNVKLVPWSYFSSTQNSANIFAVLMVHFTVVGRVSARIRLSLKINISLTIGEIYKMVEDFFRLSLVRFTCP